MQISPYFVRFRTRLFRELQAINRRYFKDGALFTPVAYLRPFRDPHRINPPNLPEQDLGTMPQSTSTSRAFYVQVDYFRVARDSGATNGTRRDFFP